MVLKPLTSEETREFKNRFLDALDQYLNAREINGWYDSVNTNASVKETREALGRVFVEALLIVH